MDVFCPLTRNVKHIDDRHETRPVEGRANVFTLDFRIPTTLW